MILRYAVMGNPIAHSLSPAIHQAFAKQTGIALSYEKILIDLAQFERQVTDFFSQGGRGLNITLPCKERAFLMSEVTTSRCLQVKAANTLWMQNGTLHADNTDGIGLLRDLGRYVHLKGKRILVIGAGGAARGILGALITAAPQQLTITNRSYEKLPGLQTDFPSVTLCAFDALANNAYDIVINATSAGLNEETLNLPLSVMTTKPFCYDLMYDNKKPTPFTAWAKKIACQAVNGLGMLIEQAAESFFIWNGIMPDTTALLRKYKIYT